MPILYETLLRGIQCLSNLNDFLFLVGLVKSVHLYAERIETRDSRKPVLAQKCHSRSPQAGSGAVMSSRPPQSGSGTKMSFSPSSYPTPWCKPAFDCQKSHKYQTSFMSAYLVLVDTCCMLGKALSLTEWGSGWAGQYDRKSDPNAKVIPNI